MKYFFRLLCLIFFPLLLLCGLQDPKTVNDYVKTQISIKQQKLKTGSSGNILMYLKPKKGIHINLTPKISVTFDSSTSRFASAGSLEIPQAAKTNYLDSKKPISQRFKFSSDIKPGPVTLKGTLTYYYCSDAEGWCSKFKQPIEATVVVTQ